MVVLKTFVWSLLAGKFDNLEDHSGNYDDLPSSMNQDDNPFQTKSLPRHMKHLE
jgi:nitrogen fixation-related uncharacterized protein